jgi:hypothetical protein
MNRTIHILAWGIAGTVLTGALTGAAIVVANGIDTPVRPFSLTSVEPLEQPIQRATEPHEGQGNDRDLGGSDAVGQPGEDQVGEGAPGSNSGPGSGSSDSGSDDVSGDSGGEHGGDDD